MSPEGSAPALARASSAPLPAPVAPLRLAIAGGGTGGHIVPGLHLLEHLGATGQRLADLLWFTSGRAVEQSVMESLSRCAGGAPLEVRPLTLERPGGGAPSLPRLTLRLPPNVARARTALRAHRTQVLLGLGGFTTVPAALAARSLRIPVCLLEINAVAGRATRVLAPLCERVFHAWPASRASWAGDRHRLVGPPLPPALRGLPSGTPAGARSPSRARAALGFDPARPLLVVLGGSQGAKALNDFVRRHASILLGSGLQVLHQVGPGRASEAAPDLTGYRPVEYVDDVPAALAAADVVLCRGGASTLAEVAAMAVPAVVVPYPHHPDRHQERNAEQLGAGARIVPEQLLDLALCRELVRLLGPQGVEERERMGAALAGCVPDDAAQRILDGLSEVRRPVAR